MEDCLTPEDLTVRVRCCIIIIMIYIKDVHVGQIYRAGSANPRRSFSQPPRASLFPDRAPGEKVLIRQDAGIIKRPVLSRSRRP